MPMTRKAAAATLALAGLVLFGQGAWIHAKALLAQVLLERAFTETITSGRETKPWSWADTWPVARIEVKRLHASTIVLAGSSGQALAFGPGHVEQTPDAGERGVAVYFRAPRHAFPFSHECCDRRHDRRDAARRQDIPLPRHRHHRSAVRRIGHRSLDPRIRTGAVDLLAAGRRHIRPDALCGACDDG
jgi:sortase A